MNTPKKTPKGAKAKPDADAVTVILKNRKLRHDYAVLDTWEAGMVLMGSEVKSIRGGDVQIGDAHARFEKGELWLYGLHVGEYRQAGVFGHTPLQPRKLLLKKKELEKLHEQLKGKGLTLIPDQVHFRRGYARIVICLAKGKTHGDKRQDMVKRATQRDVEREMSRRTKER